MKIELISIHVTPGTRITQRNVPRVVLKTLRRSLLPSLGFHHFSFFMLLPTISLPAIFFRESQKSSSNTIQKVLPLINNKFPFSVDELEMFDKLSCFLHIRRDSCFVVGLNSVNLSFFVRWNNSRRAFRFCAGRLSSISATSNDSISVRLLLL